MDILHVYSQEYEHDEAHIVGTWSELAKLRAAVDKAMMEGSGRMDSFVNDGEGFSLGVLCVKPDVRLAVPYTEEIARETRTNVIWPWEIQGSMLVGAEK